MQLIEMRFCAEEPVPVSRYALIDVNDHDYPDFKLELEDSIAGYMEAVFDNSDRSAYDIAVKAILDASGRQWIPVRPDTIRI